jgi:hypothetical protein
VRASSILIFFLLLGIAFTFFIGGYLFSFVLNKQNAASVQVVQRTPLAGSDDPLQAPLPPSYQQRQTAIQSSQNTIDQAYASGQSRASQAAKQQAMGAIQDGLDKIDTKVRSVIGNRLGDIVQPFTSGVSDVLTEGLADQSTSPPDPASVSTRPYPPSVTSENLDTIQASSANPSSGPFQPDRGPLPTSPMPGGPGPSAQETFLLEVLKTPEGTQAYDLVKNIQTQGLTQAQVQRDYDGGQVIYRVTVGPFATYQESVRARAILNRPARIIMSSPMGGTHP